nr:NUDIX domain-containing protein [Rubellimicrobium thermophilum]
MLADAQGRVFIARRADQPESSGHAWQLPQGGIDEGESAEQAALRELEEETGIPPCPCPAGARGARAGPL